MALSDIVQAAMFAEMAHSEQTHKYTGESYFSHPSRVAKMVEQTGADDHVVAAAYLHDVAEDVPLAKLQECSPVLVFVLTGDSRETRLALIATVFGRRIASLVEQVTDISKPSDGNRKTRKEIDRQHLAKATPEAKTIKLADLIDNSRDIIKNDPDFAVTYMREKALLMEVLTQGSAELYMIASEIIREYQEARGPECQF